MVYPEAEIVIRPLADGGEGTLEAITLGMEGGLETVSVTGPIGVAVDCPYGIIYDKQTAIIEISGAAGLPQVPMAERNPLKTTTYGVGEVIKAAIQKSCRHFIVGIGGSATNDGGIGMLQALGFGILDKDGRQVAFGAQGLSEIVTITDQDVIPELRECTFRIACDVNNPLCGESGCSAVFGPQKGATAEMISQMDCWLQHYVQVARDYNCHADAEQPGTGAAGGLGFAFLTFTSAILDSGIKIVIEETELERYIKDADFVITGEGRLDGQTAMGKAPAGVAELAKRYKKPVIAFAGCVTKDAGVCNQVGIDSFFPILREVAPLENVMEKETAKDNLKAAAEQVFRLVRVVER